MIWKTSGQKEQIPWFPFYLLAVPGLIQPRAEELRGGLTAAAGELVRFWSVGLGMSFGFCFVVVILIPAYSNPNPPKSEMKCWNITQ